MDAYTCATCGQPFTPRRGRAKRYCSSDCYYNRAGGRVTAQRACEVCGTRFWPEDEPGRQQRACSRTCADVLRRTGEPKVCAWCGDEFYVKRVETERRICCSRQCSARLREQQHRDVWVSGTRGRYVEGSGYVVVQIPPSERPKHSSRDRRGRILEHRYVMEEHLGRPLTKDESVHHKNGDRQDNRLENLELWSSMHPYGKRVEDLLAFARQIIDLYG